MAIKEGIIAGIVTIFAGALIVFSATQRASVDGRERQPERHETAEVDGHYPVGRLGNPAELAGLKTKALLGERGAAARLVELYENCLSRHHLKLGSSLPDASACEREMQFWIIIGSENGDLDMMGLRFNGYFARESCEDTYRAKFWLDKVIRQDKQEPWLTMAKSIAGKLEKCASRVPSN